MTVSRTARPRRSAFAKLKTEAPEVEVSASAAVPTAGRPPLREAVRPDDPRARAAKRAAEVRGHLGGDMDEGTDDFYIDSRIIPDGWTYEWKRQTVLGAEDPAYDVAQRRKGWEPVDASRHPELMPTNFKDSAITRKGMILMERPKELTDEARAIEKNKARRQVRQKEEQLAAAKSNEFDRNNKDSSLVKISKTYEAMPVPTE